MRAAFDRSRDRGRIGTAAGPAEADATLDPLEGMLAEQLQDPDEVLRAAALSEPHFEVAAQFGERGGEMPIPVERRMIEGGRLALQNREKMQRIEHFFAAAVAPFVA